MRVSAGDRLTNDIFDVIDVDARDASVDLVNEALRQAELCPTCGGAFIVGDQQGEPRCGRCGEAPEY